MPAGLGLKMKSVQIDEAAKVVVVEYREVVTDGDLESGISAYAKLGPKYSVLIDLSNVIRFEVTSEGLRKVARLTAGPDARQRCALIAPTPLAYGLARMYGILCEEEAKDTAVGVFGDAISARRWLGLSD
jgi:hypothetical protein